VTARWPLAGLALVFALAHGPFLATSLEDIDSVNFALGLRHFDVAEHRPHPPGYPVYVAAGRVAVGVLSTVAQASESALDARALGLLSLIAGLGAIPLLYRIYACLGADDPSDDAERLAVPWRRLDLGALGAAAITVSSPLFSYMAVRPMSDLPGLAAALAAQACLVLAWWRQSPGPDGRVRPAPAVTAASGRMIVAGALLAGFAVGVRTQTLWFTAPLLLVVLADRTGRGVLGAIVGSLMTFTIGCLAWGVPLLVASGGLTRYLVALGTQAGEDFMGGEMLYQQPTPRAAAAALLRTFVHPWDSPTLATVVLALAAFGLVQMAMRERRSLTALVALSAPYLTFHLVFQDTAFVRYALPIVPVVAFLAMRGVVLASEAAVPVVAAVVSVWAMVVAGPVLSAYAATPSPTARVLGAMAAEARTAAPAALGMHQTFRRPLEAETFNFGPQLASPPRREWLEVARYWRDGHPGPLWFLADPVRTDLALVDPLSRRDVTDIAWPIVARPAFGGMRPSAVRWYKLSVPGWFAEEGWSLTPEVAGTARLTGRGPDIAPITAWVRRRPGATRLLIGGRNLGAATAPAVRLAVGIDDRPLETWEAPPGFFLRVIDVPAGRLSGDGEWAHLTVGSVPATGGRPVATAIEQFDLQDPGTLMWGYADGWHEAEYTPETGVWRWTSARSVIQVEGATGPLRAVFSIESPLRNFDDAPRVRVMAGDRELASSSVASGLEWAIDVPADAIRASGGRLTIETDRTFVPAERGGPADERRLGLRIFGVRLSNSLTPAEVNR